jgi:hypothetical protein
MMNTFRKLAIRLGLAFAVATAVATASTGIASAYTYTNWGSPGYVSTPRITGQTLDSVTGEVTFPARTVYKSSAYAGYQQKVCVTYFLRYTMTPSTSWTAYANGRTCKTLTTNNSTTIGGLYWDVDSLFIWGGNVMVQWYLSNGTMIAQTVQYYNQTSDYWCSSCYISSSNSLGAYLLM